MKSAMKLFNETPFQVRGHSGMLEPGQPFLTIVVKGTFTLKAGAVAEALAPDEQPKPGPAVVFMDDYGNSLKTDNDMVPFKKQADCIFVGSAHSPSVKPVKTLEVAFGIGAAFLKRLGVHGDRSWVREADGSVRLTGPEPFTEIPIREEYAHGGPKSNYNRHGIGFGELPKTPGAEIRVANIMPAVEGLAPWDRDEESAGFGVQPPMLLPRRRLAGTYDTVWQYRRRPLPPHDFDPAFYNAARADQQIEGHLLGNEEIYLKNLHPTVPEFRAWLPGLAVRCFVHRAMDLKRGEDFEFAEVVTQLDTCVVDVPAETLTLLWRGTVATLSKKHERIRYMLVVAEPIDAPQTREHYLELLSARIKTKRPPKGGSEISEETFKEIDALNKRGLDQMLKTLRAGGAPETLIAQVEKQTTVDAAMKILTDHVEEVAKDLPPPPE